MAVTPMALVPHHYIGLSSDTKPTTDVPVGSRFWERTAATSTALEWIWDGANWSLILYPEAP